MTKKQESVSIKTRDRHHAGGVFYTRRIERIYTDKDGLHWVKPVGGRPIKLARIVNYEGYELVPTYPKSL